MVQHIICVRHLSFLVSNDGKTEVRLRDFVNVLHPSAMGFDRVGGKTDELDPTLGKFGFQFGKGAELGGAHWSIIFRMRKEDDPFVADEFVEVDRTCGGVGLEVWGCGT